MGDRDTPTVADSVRLGWDAPGFLAEEVAPVLMSWNLLCDRDGQWSWLDPEDVEAGRAPVETWIVRDVVQEWAISQLMHARHSNRPPEAVEVWRQACHARNIALITDLSGSIIAATST